MKNGLYHYLGDLSLWGILIVCMIIYGLAVVVLYPMRAHFEGAAYNTAFSSKVGDFFLTAGVLFAWVLLQSGVKAPEWATGWGWVTFAAIAATVVAYSFTFGPGPLGKNQITDLYHNSFVMLTIASVLIWIAPLVLFNGSFWSAFVGLCLVGGWGLLVWSDFGTGRIHQRDWLKINDPTTYALLVRHDQFKGR